MTQRNELLGGRPRRRVHLPGRDWRRQRQDVALAFGPAEHQRERSARPAGPAEQVGAAGHVAVVPDAVLELEPLPLQARDLSPRVRQPLAVRASKVYSTHRLFYICSPPLVVDACSSLRSPIECAELGLAELHPQSHIRSRSLARARP